DLETRIKFVEMLQDAKDVAGDSPYGQRIQIIIDEMAPVETLRAELAERIKMGKPRDNNPVAEVANLAEGQKPVTYELKNTRDGSEPEPPTTFTVVWDDGGLVFDIVCP
ncbi:MAG: hypothetical protein ABR497_12220, partial [Kiritimatiellia bacterium]